jgi:hypothetical protein
MSTIRYCYKPETDNLVKINFLCVASGICFRLLLPPAHQLTLLWRTFKLMSSRTKKIGEEEKSIFKCRLGGCGGNEIGPMLGRGKIN